MTYTATRTTTYTTVDVRKTFESFRSDLRLMSMTSTCEPELVDDRADDILDLAVAGYLKSVHVMLHDQTGVRVRAAQFTVSEEASTWKSSMPGNNIWPKTPGGWITLVVEYTEHWRMLAEANRDAFRRGLRRPWGPSDLDTTYAEMLPGDTRRYASNAYGLEQRTYTRRGMP